MHIFSSQHVSGERLGQVTGVAAVLRYPLPEIYIDGEEGFDASDLAAGADERPDEQAPTDVLDFVAAEAVELDVAEPSAARRFSASEQANLAAEDLAGMGL